MDALRHATANHAEKYGHFNAIQNRVHLRSQLRRAPSEIRDRFLDRYERTEENLGIRAANLEALAFGERQKSGLPITASNSDLNQWAEHKATYCRLIEVRSRDAESAFHRVEQLAASIGLKPPNGATVEGRLKRAAESKWWRRAARSQVIRNHEADARDMGMVGTTAPCVSDFGLQRFIDHKRSLEEALSAAYVVNELGEVFTLSEIVEASTANPRNRRVEVLVRVRGAEEYEREKGNRAVFVTLSLPSRFHRLSRGQLNPKFDGSTPRDGCKQLQHIWTKIRAEFKRRCISPRGLRVVEPHKDGTPHWHLLLFGETSELEVALQIIARYSMEESPNEPGASKHRVKTEWIDERKGSAAGYVAKYISKGLDGYALDQALLRDESGRLSQAADPELAAVRIAAWVSIWGVHQFEFIGLPPVGEYRELRRIREPVADEQFEQLRSAADGAAFARYMKAHESQAVALMREPDPTPNMYGEPRPDRVVGIAVGCFEVITREQRWVLIWDAARSVDPWTCGNNCTNDSCPAEPPSKSKGEIET